MRYDQVVRGVSVIAMAVLGTGCFFKPDAPGAASGDGGPDAPYPTSFGLFQQKSPVPVAGGPGSEGGPELSPNQLELYFMSERAVNMVMARRLWVAHRSDPSQDWSNPSWLGAGEDQADPAIMPEGLTLYFFDGSYLIRRLDRPALDAPWDDYQLPISVPGAGPFDIGGNQLRMIAGTSSPVDPASYLLEYTRASTTASWFQAPSRVAVPHSELGEVTPTLSTDGLELWWEHHAGDGSSSIYYSRRDTVTEPFPSGGKLTIPGVTFSSGDPEISADGTDLYFTELQGGDYKIFVTRREAL